MSEPRKRGLVPPTPTPSQVKAAEPATESCVRITIGDQSYVYWPLRVTPRLAAKIRAQTGFTASVWGRQVLRDTGADTVAALAWIARLQAGEDITYESTLDEFPERMPSMAVVPELEPVEADDPK